MSNLVVDSETAERLIEIPPWSLPASPKRPARRVSSGSLVSQAYLRRLDSPCAETPQPLEYAFHMLGDVSGKTVVIAGCGNGLSAIALASLGARVLAVDVSSDNLKTAARLIRAQGLTEKIAFLQNDGTSIPAGDASVDCVLCSESMDVESCVGVGRQIRRILKPGGGAVFMQPIARFGWLAALSQRLLTQPQTQSVSRAVGRGGRQREFRLTFQALNDLGMRAHSTAFGRAIASLLVWEAHKER